MSLLEVITQASANNTDRLNSESDYPIILNSDSIFLNLKPQDEESIDSSSLVIRADGWKLCQRDSEIIELGHAFYKNLNRKLKNPVSFNKDEFVSMLNSYLEKNRERLGMSGRVDGAGESYTCRLIQKVGFLMGPGTLSLVLEGCIVFKLWEVLTSLIVGGLVEHSCSSNLVRSLLEQRRSDLVCLCIKHISDLQIADILSILRYFLSPPKEAYAWMVTIRKEWEREALSAIEKANDKNNLSEKQLNLAKDASILLMVAHDEFSASELCLHYLLASPSLDDVIFTACISKLNGSEIMGFVRYLAKWLKKYEKFPQACPCPNASSVLGLKACEWVPTLEGVVKCLGLVLDEHFSSLVLHPEFREELRSLESIVSCLASEARLCCSVANITRNLKTDRKADGGGYAAFYGKFLMAISLWDAGASQGLGALISPGTGIVEGTNSTQEWEELELKTAQFTKLMRTRALALNSKEGNAILLSTIN